MVTLSLLEKDAQMYIIHINSVLSHDKCVSALHDDSWLWYRRLDHGSMDLISKNSKNDLKVFQNWFSKG